MFKSLKKLRRSWSDFVNFDPEAARLAQAGDLIDLEMIQRDLDRRGRRSYGGY
jgi:hypothetical protein